MARTQRFPKRLRNSLSTRIDNLALGILEEVTTAAYRRNKKSLLMRTDEKLGKLKVLMRLSHELQLLSHGQYEEIALRLSESGRMLGGWLRTEGAKTPG